MGAEADRSRGPAARAARGGPFASLPRPIRADKDHGHFMRRAGSRMLAETGRTGIISAVRDGANAAGGCSRSRVAMSGIGDAARFSCLLPRSRARLQFRLATPPGWWNWQTRKVE